MKYLLLPFLFCFGVTMAFAQLEKSDIHLVKEAEFAARNYQGEVEGSPFFNDDWQPGLVLLKSGKASNLVKLKYNMLHNRLILQRNGNTYAVTPNRMEGFVFVDGGHRTKFKKGFQSNEYNIKPSQFLRMIYDGKVKLAVQYQSSKHQRRDAFTGAVAIKFITDQSHYLITPDDTFHETELEEDDILEVLGRQQERLKQFAQKNNLDWKKPEDLQKILAYYDDIINEAG